MFEPTDEKHQGDAILKEAVRLAQDAGLWQELRLQEKNDLVIYFHTRFLTG